MDYINFTEEDIQNRIENCQGKIKVNDWSGIVVSAESNVKYYSHYGNHAPWTTFTRPAFLFIPREGKPVIYVQTFVVPEAHEISMACEVKGFDSLLGPTAKELKQIMVDLNMNKGKVGFELGYEQRIGFQVDTYEALKEELKEVEFVDASNLIWSQRIIKSPKEIECIRRACQATSYAHDNIFPNIKEGMTEHEISKLVQKYMLDGGADYPGFVIITSGTGNYERISATSTNRKIQNGDLLWIDLGARYNGYWSDFCRAGVVGKISEERKALQAKIHEITMNAAEIMKPGVSVKELAQKCADEMTNAGFEATFDCGRMGHGMGLMSTEPPSVTIYDDTILQEGMIINLEPGVVDDTGVYDIEENFVITKDGYELLSGGQRELHQIK